METDPDVQYNKSVQRNSVLRLGKGHSETSVSGNG